ncbi:MAG: amidohydrolase [Pseudomonadota bacterium]
MSERQQLISGGKIFTANPDQPWAGAMLVEAGKIIAVGNEQEIVDLAETDAVQISVNRGLVVPGFVDGHVHLMMTGSAMQKAQLQDAGSLEEIQRRVLAWAEANPDAPRVLGTNWVHGDLPDATPTREMLDAIVPDRPVYLEAFDFHSSWLNTAALKELGIDRNTPDPVGGQFVRDPKTGEATGFLLENASVNYVWTLLNNVDETTMDDFNRTALEAFVRSGITSVVDMAMEEPALESLQRLQASGELGVRVVAHMIIFRCDDPHEEMAQVERAIELSRRFKGDFLRVGGIKIIADGTIDNCTASLSKPYSNGHESGPIWDSGVLDPVVRVADAAGLQVAVHAIGDAAVTMAIDSIEKAMQVNNSSACRHRIEHLEYALPEDIERMGALGITASMQPVHVNPEFLDNWKEMLGPERAQQGWAWPLYQKAGSTLAFGTDTPTAPYLPLINMYLASTRKSPDRPDIVPIRPDWALALDEAIICGTRESAWAARLEHAVGMLKPGLDADLVILDRDVIGGGPSSLLETNVSLTMKRGEIVYAGPE